MLKGRHRGPLWCMLLRGKGLSALAAASPCSGSWSLDVLPPGPPVPPGLASRVRAGVRPRGEPLCWLCLQERFVVHVTDVLAVSMMLGITAQVKEAGIAWDKGEKKSEHRARLG